MSSRPSRFLSGALGTVPFAALALLALACDGGSSAVTDAGVGDRPGSGGSAGGSGFSGSGGGGRGGSAGDASAVLRGGSPTSAARNQSGGGEVVACALGDAGSAPLVLQLRHHQHGGWGHPLVRHLATRPTLGTLELWVMNIDQGGGQRSRHGEV